MKLQCLVLASLLSFSAFANSSGRQFVDENIEIVNENENIEVPKIRIAEVKDLIKKIGTDNTCMDEYLQRRRQLIAKLALSPVTIVGGTYASLFVGAFAGLGVAILTNAAGMDPLLYVAWGVIGGGVVAGTATATDTSLAAFQLADIDTILKSLAEQHLNQSGKKSGQLYDRYLKGSETPASPEVFFAKLMDFDGNGQLCDGSLTKKDSYKLKKRLARTKHLRNAI